MLARIAVVTVATINLIFPSSANAEALHLICGGSGTENDVSTASAYAVDARGNTYQAQAVGSDSVPFADRVEVALNDDNTGRIRMPPNLYPPMGDGDNGWFNLKNVARTDKEITGSVKLNFINSPKVRIDRLQGTITINGRIGNYSGECRAFDPATVERKF
jgi:hypothetical protein